MSKEVNNVEEIEIMETEEEVMETETKQKFGSKIVAGVKKHGKKIVTGVAVIAVGALGYALGKKSGCEEEDYFEDDDEVEFDLIEDNSEEVDPE